MRRLLNLILVILALAAAAPAMGAERPVVVLVSIDGFRADYLDRGVTPVLSGLAAGGVRAGMRPSYPSKTFPNHYTLVTGRRPDTNGIVANNMRDPAMPGVTFSMSNRAAVQDGVWWGQAEPIWITAERAGQVAAAYFWPGSEAEIHGLRPRYWKAFDQKTPADARVDADLALLDAPVADRPSFMTLYFDVVDTAGHDSGPESPQVNAALAQVDAAVGRLMGGLAARAIPANVIIVSDHGMAQVSPDRRIFLDDLVPKEAYSTLDLGPLGTIYPAPGREAEVEAVLTARRPHLQCWRRDRIPARLHYGHNPRVAPIVCMPDAGWVLTTHSSRTGAKVGGEHGYDNAAPEMRAIFVANGPAFRPGVRLKTFDNVSVYPLLAHLLGLSPQPNEGRLADLAGGLRSRH